MITHPVPKPQSKKSREGKHQNSTASVFTCKTIGAWNEEMAFTNLLNLGVEAGIVEAFTSEGAHGRGDGRVERTYRLKLKGAANYDTRAEQPYVDKSADIYVMLSESEPDKVKVGLSIHVRIREGQVSRKFEEPFKVIHVVHALHAKARETWIHNYLRDHGAVDLGHEQFRIKDWHLDWLRSLPNE